MTVELVIKHRTPTDICFYPSINIYRATNKTTFYGSEMTPKLKFTPSLKTQSHNYTYSFTLLGPLPSSTLDQKDE